MIDADLLARLAPDCERPTVVATKLAVAMKRFGITTPRRAALFLAQLMHECPGLNPTEENLDYSARRLREVWPKRFPTLAVAERYAHDPRALANRVYAGRMGNGTEESGDGWRFRGRGFIQLTGRDNYGKYGRKVGFDLLENPDLVLQIGVGALVAAAYWHENGCSPLADAGNIEEVTLRINGGRLGLAERERLYLRTLSALGLDSRLTQA